MAGEVGSAYVEILADVHKFERDLADKVRRSAEKEGGKAGQLYGRSFSQQFRAHMQKARLLSTTALGRTSDFARAARLRANAFSQSFMARVDRLDARMSAAGRRLAGRFANGFRLGLSGQGGSLDKAFSRIFRGGALSGRLLSRDFGKDFARGLTSRIDAIDAAGKLFAKHFRLGFREASRLSLQKELDGVVGRAVNLGRFVGNGRRAATNFASGFRSGLGRGFGTDLTGFTRAFRRGSIVGLGLGSGRDFIRGFTARFANLPNFVEKDMDRVALRAGRRARVVGERIGRDLVNGIGTAFTRSFTSLFHGIGGEGGKIPKLLGHLLSFRGLVIAGLAGLPALIAPLGNLFNSLLESGGVLLGLPTLLTAAGGAALIFGRRAKGLAVALKPLTDAMKPLRTELDKLIAADISKIFPAKKAKGLIASLRTGLRSFAGGGAAIIGNFFSLLSEGPNAKRVNQVFRDLGQSLRIFANTGLRPLLDLFLRIDAQVSRTFPGLFRQFSVFLAGLNARSKGIDFGRIFTTGIKGFVNFGKAVVVLTSSLRKLGLLAAGQTAASRQKDGPFAGLLRGVKDFQAYINTHAAGITSFFKGVRTVVADAAAVLLFFLGALKPTVAYLKSPDFHKGLAEINTALTAPGHTTGSFVQTVGILLARLVKAVVDSGPTLIRFFQQLGVLLSSVATTALKLLPGLTALAQAIGSIATALLRIPGADKLLTYLIAFRVMVGLLSKIKAGLFGVAAGEAAVAGAGRGGALLGGKGALGKVGTGAAVAFGLGSIGGFGGPIKGAISGAIAGGIAAGPWGALAGAVGGAVFGGFQQGAARAAHDRATLAAFRAAVAGTPTATGVNTAFQSLVSGPKFQDLEKNFGRALGPDFANNNVLTIIKNLGLAKYDTVQFQSALTTLFNRGGQSKILAQQIQALGAAFDDPIKRANDFKAAADAAFAAAHFAHDTNTHREKPDLAPIFKALPDLVPTLSPERQAALAENTSTLQTLFAELKNGTVSIAAFNAATATINLAPISKATPAALTTMLAALRTAALVSGGVTGQIGTAFAGVAAAAERTGRAVPASFSHFIAQVRALLDPGDSLGQAFIDRMEAIINAARQALRNKQLVASNFGGKGINTHRPDGTPTANGGVFRQPTTRLLGEAGWETAIPLSPALSTRAAHLMEITGLADRVRGGDGATGSGVYAPISVVLPTGDPYAAAVSVSNRLVAVMR